LLTWLAGSVDAGWGREGRPADLGTPEEEAEAVIDHLLQQGNSEEAGEPGHLTVRLVRPVRALEKSVARLRGLEEEAREVAGKRLREGGWVPVAEVLPSSWKARAVKEVGERLTRAVGQAVLGELKRQPGCEVRTAERGRGRAVEEVRLAPSGDVTAGHAAEGDTGQAKTAAPPAVGRPEVVILPVSLLRPNDWNPNKMTQEQEGELLREVRRLGRPAKPIVVRRLGDGTYEIVDGEHGWAAAKEAGLTEVPCEVAEVDAFEAMRQTYARNQHGTRDPLLTGRLFRRMLGLRGLSAETSDSSQRAFARENNINEATLRNYLLYAEAAEVRKRYAPETADETIGGLPVAKVRVYLALPEDRRDEWLDRGASSQEGNRILAESGRKARGPKGRVEARPAGDGAARPEAVAGEPEGGPGPTTAEGEAGDGVSPAAPAGEEGKPAGPLSPEERGVVGGVLKAYRDGRAAVRQKILAGLGAYPDAVAFFRRMIRSGS